LKPEAIILLGDSAVTAFMTGRYVGDDNGIGGINRWRGFAIPDKDAKCFVYPMYHPNFVLSYTESERPEPVIGVIFDKDFSFALSEIEKRHKFGSYEPCLPKPNFHFLETESEIEQWFEKILLQSFGLATIDWETTGLRPQAKGIDLISASVTSEFTDGIHTIAFLVPETKTFAVTMKRFLSSNQIKLTAHNIAFEKAWAMWEFSSSIPNMFWDSQMMAHLLDNRSKITSLKFQTCVNFGVPDYDSHMAKWLKPGAKEKKEHGANAVNTVRELIKTSNGKRTLLEYNAWDTFYEYLLAKKQMELLGFDDVLPLPF
jgi:hypothetical protein